MRLPLRLFTLSAFVLLLGASTARAETAGQFIDDATITTKVKAAITTDTVLKNTDVEVKTTQGVVALTGTVSSKDQEFEVVKLANHADGVKSVTDLLRVTSTTGQ